MRVIHTPGTVTLVRPDPPDDLDEGLGRPWRPGRLTFREVLDLPEPDDDF